MKILAVEFSAPQRSVAVVEEKGGLVCSLQELERRALLGQRSLFPDSAEQCSALRPTDSRRGQLSEIIDTGPGWIRAIELVDEALRQAGLEREQIECLALGLGPGSYTGIRAALALAQGWQLACGVQLLGVSSAETLAAQAHAEGLRGAVNVVIDAQRNELYLARYELIEGVVAGATAPDRATLGVPLSGDPDGLKPGLPTAGAGREWRAVEPLRLASLAEVQERERAGELLVGPEVTRWFPAGRILFPRAATLGRLAAGRSDFVPGEKLEPIYLRETAFVKAPPPRVIP